MSLLLFNWCGYRLISSSLEMQADQHLEAQFDQNSYDESSLIAITVPLHLPYQVTNHEFKRVDGEISFNGIIYKYVKRRIVNDSMVVLCVPNHAKMKLVRSKDNFFAKTADLAQNKESKSKQSGSYSKSVFSDAELKPFDWSPNLFAQSLRSIYFPHQLSVVVHNSGSPGKPPEVHIAA